MTYLKVFWFPAMDVLLGTDIDRVIANRLGIHKSHVLARRQKLGVPAAGLSAKVGWTPAEETLIGTMPDEVLAVRLRVSAGSVHYHRRKLGVPAFGPIKVKWTPEMDTLLGTMSDQDIANELGVTYRASRRRRRKLGILRHQRGTRWTSKRDVLLGPASDFKIAKKLGLTYSKTWSRRNLLGIPSWKSQQVPLEGTRYERMQKLSNTLTSEQWKFACDYFENRCAYCGKEPYVLAEDHLKPLSKSGPRTALNIVPACSSCNSSKNNKLAHIWIYEHFGTEQGKQIIDRIIAYLTEVQECLKT